MPYFTQVWMRATWPAGITVGLGGAVIDAMASLCAGGNAVDNTRDCCADDGFCFGANSASAARRACALRVRSSGVWADAWLRP